MSSAFRFSTVLRSGDVVDLGDDLKVALARARRFGSKRVQARYREDRSVFVVAELKPGPRGGAPRWVRTERGEVPAFNYGRQPKPTVPKRQISDAEALREIAKVLMQDSDDADAICEIEDLVRATGRRV